MNYNRVLHRFALFTSFSTFCLIIAGGLVTSTQSGLAVPDWPLSYGQVMPPMVGGILYEHSHRMVATFVGLLTIILALWLWRREGRQWVKILGVLALGAVIVQGILGGLTVLFMLPTPVSVSHAMLAQTFFVLVAAIALFTSRWWQSLPAPQNPTRQAGEHSYGTEHKYLSPLKLVFLTTLAVYVQLILGVLMRHTGSGLAVPDFPLAFGQFFPSLSPEALSTYNQQLIRDDIRLAADGPITFGQVLIHMLHRLWAVVVAGMVVWIAIRLRKISARMIFFSWVLAGLLVTQIILGALTVVTLKSVVITTAHVATGALLLVTSALVTLHVAKIVGYQFSNVAVRLSPKEAVV